MAPPAAGAVRGVVEAPARPGGYQRPVAWRQWLRVGAPAYASARIARRPLASAQVHLIDRATRQSVSATVTTNARGEFRIENVTPSSRFSVAATDGQISLEAVLPAGDPGRREVRVAVNEASTVGAEAARLAEEEGLGPDSAVALAQQIAELQESRQAEHPAEAPDLSRAEDVKDRARDHLLRTADTAVAGALDTRERAEAWRAVASAQLLARSRFKLPSKVRLTPLQVEAIANAAVRKETRAVSAEQIVTALGKAGVKDKEGKAVTAGQVGTALESLRKPLPSLKDVKTEEVPVVAALLLAQQGDGFQIATREQMKAFLKELVGEVEEPEEPGRGKPSVAAIPRSGQAPPVASPPVTALPPVSDPGASAD